MLVVMLSLLFQRTFLVQFDQMELTQNISLNLGYGFLAGVVALVASWPCLRVHCGDGDRNVHLSKRFHGIRHMQLLISTGPRRVQTVL